MTTVIITFLLFLSLFVIIGVLSVIKSKNSTSDYLVANRNIPPWLASLSAAATNTSGYMFIGLIGYTYKFGISSIWVTVGWITGDFIIWKLIYKKLRRESSHSSINTIPGFIGQTKNGKNKLVIFIAGLITLLFLGTYASAQLVAGGKALHVLFNWDYKTGSIIGAIIVFLYCFAGGIRASIWTDAAQALVMIISMAFLLGSAIIVVGNPVTLLHKLKEINPMLVHLFPKETLLGIPPYLLGWFAAGIGVAGQPHMLIRIFSIDSEKNIPKAMRTYFSWYIPFSIAAVGVGLYARVLLDNPATFDAELALPVLSMQLMPKVFVGMILAGLFAATMSTADSQILSSGAALTQDMFPQFGKTRLRTKMGTLFIVSMALLIAITGRENKSVFQIVIMAWSALGAIFGPLIILRSLRQFIPPFLSILMMALSLITVLLWRFLFKLNGAVYEILPGLLVSFAVYGIYRVILKKT